MFEFGTKLEKLVKFRTDKPKPRQLAWTGGRGLVWPAQNVIIGEPGSGEEIQLANFLSKTARDSSRCGDLDLRLGDQSGSAGSLGHTKA
jgi:hypothetical protein